MDLAHDSVEPPHHHRYTCSGVQSSEPGAKEVTGEDVTATSSMTRLCAALKLYELLLIKQISSSIITIEEYTYVNLFMLS